MINMRYTRDHDYVRLISADTAVVGISAWAGKMLGTIVSVQLPTIGSTVKTGEEIALLESTKAACEVYAPLSGEISAINLDVLERPEYINQDPFAKGWLFQITKLNTAELTQLLDEESYAQYCTSITSPR